MDQTEEYLKRILKVLIYIEEQIDEELRMGDLAKVACYSPFHFHRIFQAVVGETVHQYVKRLRIERAAGRLRYTDQPVTEIALDASYDTPSAFTKAFKKFMGESPQNYRAFHAAAFKSLAHNMQHLEEIYPEKIEKIADLNLLFIRRYGRYDKSSPQEAWVAMSRFIAESGIDPTKVRRFGIFHDDPVITGEEKIRYDACILAPLQIKERGEVGREVLKGGKYAVFTNSGPYDALELAFARISLKWLPSSGETYDDTRAPFCEHFHMERLYTAPETLVTKIYIPLV